MIRFPTEDTERKNHRGNNSPYCINSIANCYKMEDLSHFCCQNMECPDYGKRGTGRLTVCMYYGKDRKRRLVVGLHELIKI